MMKQVIFISAFILIVLVRLGAQGNNTYDIITWKVIGERLFDGSKTKATRYEEDIRIILKGAESSQDSAVVIELIDELNQLIQTINVSLVKEDGNFFIIREPEYSVITNRTFQKIVGSQILNTRLQLNAGDFNKPKEVSPLYYFVFRNLTKIYEPRHGKSEYGGIFDSGKPETAKLHEIDKNLIRKLYSENFYSELRKNMIAIRGFFYYIHLRYQNYLVYAPLIGGILISVFLFFYFLSGGAVGRKNLSYKRYLLNGILISVSIALLYVLIMMPQQSGLLIGFHILKTMKVSFINSLILGFLAASIMFLIEKEITKRISNIIQKQVLIFLSTFFSILITLLIIMAAFIVFYSTKENISIHFENTFYLAFIAILVAGLRIVFNILNLRIQSMVNQKDVEIARMRELKNQAELNALYSRINPHFLYNSLNSIAGLAHLDPDKTERMAISLSSLFRYSINKEDKTYATVEEELEMVTKFLEVEKLRFDEKLQYTIKAEEHLLRKEIPRFLIQPLVENALKHGLAKITEQGILKIEVKQEQNDLIIKVYDNGPDFPDEPVTGYGLQNLHDKLQLLYGDDAVLNWYNGKNKFIQVTLKGQL